MYLVMVAFPEAQITLVVVESDIATESLYRSQFFYDEMMNELVRPMNSFNIQGIVLMGPVSYINKLETDIKYKYPNIEIIKESNLGKGILL